MNFRILLLLFALGFIRHRIPLILHHMRWYGALFPETPSQQLRLEVGQFIPRLERSFIRVAFGDSALDVHVPDGILAGFPQI